MTHSFCTLLLCFVTLLISANAHSKIEIPESESFYECADVPGFYEPHNSCTGPCSTFLNEGGYPTRNSPDSPAQTWKRGEKRYIGWTKNNHFGGFIRFTLVPISKKMSKRSHEYYAFEYGCWSSGITSCDNELECGSDRTGRRYSRNITIPACYPDGLYVFGVVWYGGRENECCGGARQDFWSCSNIRIEGGAPLQDSCEAIFWPGDDKKSCVANVNAIGMPTEVDKGSDLKKVPKEFEGGHKPPPFYSKYLIKDLNKY